MAQPALAFSRHRVTLASEIDFDGWRDAARQLAMEGIAAEEVEWTVAENALTSRSTPTPARRATSAPINGREQRRETRDLASGGSDRARTENEESADAAAGLSSPPSIGGEVASAARQSGGRPHATSNPLLVPRAFIEAAQTAILHHDPQRFAFLYRMLTRFQSEPKLMHIASDPDIRKLEEATKAIRRDIHKMRAFVRFRKVDEAGEHYLAWFEPAHFIVERNADFFVRRFAGMRWSILTPYRSAHWDGEALAFGPGADKRDVPADDAAEDLWLTYYRNIFNPARLKVKAMQAEMPKKYWRNLPEAALIPELIGGAERAAKEMIERMPTTPAPHHAKVQAKHWPNQEIPSGDLDQVATTLDGLRTQAEGCRRCPLWRDATQTVFGAGPDDAKIVFVGEQPGDQEDIAGEPFVGPAGKVFDAAVIEAGIDRQKTYVTNAVKHFKFEPRGKRRIHSKPNAGEVQACRWWLEHELSLIKPHLVVALGATAAQSLLGKPVAITKMRGQVIERQDGLKVFLTIHPSFILHIRERDEAEAERARFVDDMRHVRRLMA